MRRLLHIGIGFHGPAKSEQVEEKLDSAKDWLRYAANCWVVYTSKTVDHWTDQLLPLLEKEDTLLVVEIKSSEVQGWLGDSLWKWFEEKEKA